MAEGDKMGKTTDAVSPQAFWAALQRSEALTANQAAEVKAALSKGAAAEKVSRQLVDSGSLTSWQATQLLAGVPTLKLGNYKLLDMLDKTSWGRVYLGQHTKLARRVVLSTLSVKYASQPDLSAEFLGDAQAAAKLDHRNLLHVYDVDQDGERLFAVSEHVEGLTAEQRVEQSGPLPPVDAARWIQQAAEGLAHAHQHNLYHGELLPRHLLIDEDNVVKIAGLGLSKLPVDQESDGFAAPEQLAGTTASAPPHAPDVYRLGAVFHFLVAGSPPGQSTVPEDMPPPLRKALALMLTEEPEKRPAAEPLQKALASWLETQPAPAPTPLPSKSADEVPIVQVDVGSGPSNPAAGAESGGFPAFPAVSATRPAASPAGQPAVVPTGGQPATPAGVPSISTKGKGRRPKRGARPSNSRPPANEAPSGATAAAGSVAAPRSAPRRGWLIGAIAGASLLLVGGIVAIVLWTGGGDDEPTEIADATETQQQDAAPQKAADDLETDPTPSNLETDPPRNLLESDPPRPPAAAPVAPAPGDPTAVPADPMPADPMPADPMPADPKPADPKPADPKTDPAEPKPADPKPADPKPADPKPADPKPEEPKPADPKPAEPPAPAAKPVFAQFPAAIDLPTFDEPRKDLGPIHLEQGQLCTVFVRGGEEAGPNGKFKYRAMNANSGTALRDWEVSVEPLNSASDRKTIALLKHENDRLFFEWTADGKALGDVAGALRNCQFSFTVRGQKSHVCSLRTVSKIEPLELTMSKASNGKWTLEDPPDAESIMLAITKLEGPFPAKYKIDPAEPIHADKGLVLIKLSEGDEDPQLLLRVATTLRGKTLQIKVDAQLVMQGKPQRMNKTTLSNLLMTAQARLEQGSQVLLAMKREQQGAGKQNVALAQQVSLGEQAVQELTRFIEIANRAKETFEKLDAGGGKIHLRVFSERGASVIDLAKSEG